MIRYIGKGALWSPEKAAEVSALILEHWRDHNFGWRVAVSKSSGEEVGFVALNYAARAITDFSPRSSRSVGGLSLRFGARAWLGEAATAICDEAFTRAGARSVVARIRPENVASQRVALALGMSFDFDTTGRFGEQLRVYRLARSAGSGRPSSGRAGP